jgi:hypothetical protein
MEREAEAVREAMDMIGADVEEGAAGGHEVRRSLASLMDILRDLLRNIQLPEAPEREDADVDSSGDDDPAQDNT